jgi:hypothetical protein
MAARIARFTAGMARREWFAPDFPAVGPAVDPFVGFQAALRILLEAAPVVAAG